MSNASVAERLQVKSGRRLATLFAPAAVDAQVGVVAGRAPAAEADVILLFTPDRAALERDLPAALAIQRPGAILWLAYPKLTSPLAADLSRDVIHRLAPTLGLTTVSQIAIDSDWSALRLKPVV